MDLVFSCNAALDRVTRDVVSKPTTRIIREPWRDKPWRLALSGHAKPQRAAVNGNSFVSREIARRAIVVTFRAPVGIYAVTFDLALPIDVALMSRVRKKQRANGRLPRE